MDGNTRYIVTVTDGHDCICLLFSRNTAEKLYRTCRAFAFDDKVHYRINLTKFRNRLSGLRSAHPWNEPLARLCAFFNRSPRGRYFAVCGGDITGSPLFMQVLRTLAMHNMEETPPGSGGKLRILANYDFTAFGMELRKTGPVVRSQRKCRFCGLSHSETSFRSKAHTISEALGNKTLFTNDECDLCNARFCQTIEREFINRLSHMFPLYNITGKNGGRKLKGKEYTVFRAESVKKIKPIVLYFSDSSIRKKTGGAPGDLTLFTRGSAREWKPRNIYRFLCKFVIGSLDRRLRRYFDKTVAWINGGRFRQTLPPVCVEMLSQPVSQPLLYIYRRRRNENLYPYMFARLHLIDCAYTFIIPFCSLDVEDLNHNGFLRSVTGLIPSAEQKWLDLNSSRKISPEVEVVFISGDHNVLCDIAEMPQSRWQPVPAADQPEMASVKSD